MDYAFQNIEVTKVGKFQTPYMIRLANTTIKVGPHIIDRLVADGRIVKLRSAYHPKNGQSSMVSIFLAGRMRIAADPKKIGGQTEHPYRFI